MRGWWEGGVGLYGYEAGMGLDWYMTVSLGFFSIHDQELTTDLHKNLARVNCVRRPMKPVSDVISIDLTQVIDWLDLADCS